MRPTFKKVLADFWENKARSFMIIASIAIGVFAVGTNGVTYVIFSEHMTNTYVSTNPANIMLTTSYFPTELVDAIENTPGVESADGRLIMNIRTRIPGDDVWKSLEVIALTDIEDNSVKTLSWESGKAVPDKGEILLVEQALKTLDVEVGDELEVELSDGTIRTLTVAGITHDYSETLSMGATDRKGFISKESMEILHADPVFNTLAIVVDGNKNDLDHIREVSKKVVDKLERGGRAVYSNDILRSIDHPFRDYVNAIILILSFIGIFTVILSSALIVNTMNALMAQHTRQIGVIKLLGGSSQQIIRMYLMMVHIFSVISLVIAVPISAFAGFQICNYAIPLLNGAKLTGSPFPLIPWVIALQTFITLLFPVLAALHPILRGAQISVQNALSARLISQSGDQTWLDIQMENIKGMVGITLLSLRNTLRQKGRLILTIFTLALASALFITVFNVQLALNRQIDRIRGYNSSDIYVQLTYDYRIEEVQQVIQQVPEVKYTEAWQTDTAQLKYDGETINVMMMAPPVDTELVNKIVQQGRWVEPNDYNTLAINENILTIYPDIKPGDTITLELNGKKDEWVISGIFQYTGLDLMVAYTNPLSLQDKGSSPYHASSYRVVTGQTGIQEQVNTADQINKVLQDNGFQIRETSSQAESIGFAMEKMNVVVSVLFFLAILTGTVGAIGLSGTLSLNVLERTAEIGILRAVGAYNKIITRLVLLESFFISLVSYVIGTILSFPISYVLTNLVNQAIFKANAGFVITWKGFVIWFLLVALLAVVASTVPARNATRLTIREVLAYE